MTETIVARGDFQAEALERMLKHAFAGTGVRLFCDQVAGDTRPEQPDDLPADTTYVRFPKLELAFLWPMSVANPYDAPSGPDGLRFPYGDAFVVSALDTGYAPKEILASCFGIGWSDTWPDLEERYARARERMLALDAYCDVTIGSFVLDTFREQQLFHAVDAPTSLLLREMVARIATAVGIVPHATGPDVGELPSAVEVPVHPTVAEHFGLKWYDPNARYRNGERTLSYAQYFEAMVAAGVATG